MDLPRMREEGKTWKAVRKTNKIEEEEEEDSNPALELGVHISESYISRICNLDPPCSILKVFSHVYNAAYDSASDFAQTLPK